MSSDASNTTFLLILTGVITLIYFATRKMFGHDPREPSLAPQSIPIVGHMIGLSRSKFNYYVDLSHQMSSPIFTIPIPGQKMYVVTKPELILAVQKQHKTLAFPPIEAKDAITIATTRSVYGPMNPYDDKAIADAFWEFESGLMLILPIAARTKVAKAFEAYYKAGGVQKASALARNRYQAEIDNNVPLEDIARYEVGGSIAIMVNTSPAAFWTLLLLHSHPGLLDDIRKEIDACTETATDNGSTVKTLDITTLKESCPLLLSSYQEVLRYCSTGTSVRKGPDVTDFNRRRFLPEEKQNCPRDVCFRAFGGGKTLCPGRHFATNEILAVVAVFIARFDMKPENSGWKLPTTANTNVAAVVMEPDHDIQVEIKTRRGFEDVKWAINLNKSEKIFAMVTE
ncbi:putative cytochrome P450 [Biscogniauxia marginata]|nr:putative cytochrome P450 [Biscogniauxia marginata]